MRILLYLTLIIIFACNNESQQKTDIAAPFTEDINIDDDFYFEKGIY